MTQPRKIESYQLQSEYLGEERTVKVFVPNLQSEQELPVLYCHDGLEFFTHGRIATIANDMMNAGELPPFYIAGIQVNLEKRRADYSMDGLRHDAYRKFVMEECIAMLDEQYRMDNSKRMMAGISLGAVATLSFALHYKDVFKHLVLFSGAYFPPVQERLCEETDLAAISAYMFIGEEEKKAKTPSGVFDFYSYNQSVRDILQGRGAQIEMHEGSGNHIWGTWQKQLPDALRWIGSQI